MPKTRSGKEHDPVKRAEEEERRQRMRELMQESKLRRIEAETKENKKKLMTRLKTAVTKKQKVGSIKLRKINGGKKTRRHRRRY